MIKRTADFEVNHGADITTIDKFMSVLQERTNVIIIRVTENDVKKRQKLIPNKLVTFKGTLNVHQVLWEQHCKRLTLRTSSCFKCICGQICDHGKHLGFIAIPCSTTISNIQAENKDHVTLLAATKPSTLSDVTSLPTTSKIDLAKNLKVKILSNKLITVLKNN